MQSDLTKHILKLLPRPANKNKDLIRDSAALTEGERAVLENRNKELEMRLAERTAELEALNAAHARDVAEHRALKERLRQAQKMESVGMLAGGIAHDFNNIMNIIQGYCSLIGSHAGENADIVESLRIINDAIKRGAIVVQQLLTLTDNTESNLERLIPAPAAPDQRSVFEHALEPHGDAARSATALVVEDDEAMLHLLRNILADRGYRVFTAVDGEEAAARYRHSGDDIDVVLLDVDLPKSSGAEVLQKIRAKNPNARVLVTSGYLEPELKAALGRAGVTRFIAKPYRPEDIIEALEPEDVGGEEGAEEPG